eukprot:2144670-Alexandrium_andersonii.AAC.1
MSSMRSARRSRRSRWTAASRSGARGPIARTTTSGVPARSIPPLPSLPSSNARATAAFEQSATASAPGLGMWRRGVVWAALARPREQRMRDGGY